MRASGCLLSCSHFGMIKDNINCPINKLNFYLMQRLEVLVYTASIFTSLS